MTVKHVSRKAVSARQKNSLPASSFYCGQNKVVVMQCHVSRETKGFFWCNVTDITWCALLRMTSSASTFKKHLDLTLYLRIGEHLCL